jgi:hypothetical protein
MEADCALMLENRGSLNQSVSAMTALADSDDSLVYGQWVISDIIAKSGVLDCLVQHDHLMQGL